jgi:ribulose-phosphate 3-epimerase
MKEIKLSPSMMCADLFNIESILEQLGQHHIDFLHIDVMDGHYVPNFTVGTDYCRALATRSSIPLDIHLMIEDVDQHLSQFAQIENACVTFHPEVCYHPLRTIQAIRSFGARVGIALDPSMAVERYKSLFTAVDMICVMTVNPGYAGQPLVPQGMQLLAQVAQSCAEMGCEPDIEVDGNVSWTNIPRMLEAGANVLVGGTSSIFSSRAPLEENIVALHTLIQEHRSLSHAAHHV